MALHRRWSEAYGSRDPARLIALYAPDAVLLDDVNPDAVWNRLTLEAHYSRAQQRAPVLDSKAYIYGGGRCGTVWVQTGEHRVTELVDGRPVQRRGRFTLVWRQIDGQWLIWSHQMSALP